MTSPKEAPAVRSLHAMLARACLSASPRFETDLGGYLGEHGLAPDDDDAMRAAPARLGLYRQLVRHNLAGVVRTMLERTEACLEARVPGVFAASVDAFLDEAGPRTPHLRDVPSEFLAWTAPRWASDPRLPPWIVDQARFELVDFTIGVAPRSTVTTPLADLHPERPVLFAPPYELLRVAWAVHAPERPWTNDPSASPAPKDVTLLVYRDAEHRCRALELSPLAAAILERLFEGRPLGAAMTDACHQAGRALDASVLESASVLFADLAERGVLLGARGG